MGGHFGRAKLQLVHSRVPEDRNPGEAWLHLLEKLKLLAAHLGDIKEEARDVAAGAGQGGDPSLGHRVRLEIYSDDRNGLSRFGRGLQRMRGGGQDDIDACGDEPSGDIGVLLDLVLLRGSDVHGQVLSDNVTQVAQTVSEGLESRRFPPRTATEPPDPRSLRGRLSMGAPRCRQ